MTGGLKRSGLFGLIGVVVVMVAVALIALNADSGDANPKGTMALIFGVIAVFVVILFVLQRSDLERVAGGDGKRSPGPLPKAATRSRTSRCRRSTSSKASCRC